MYKVYENTIELIESDIKKSKREGERTEHQKRKNVERINPIAVQKTKVKVKKKLKE